MNSGCFFIENGPNLTTIFDACRFAYTKNVDFRIKFEVVAGNFSLESENRYTHIPIEVDGFQIVGVEHVKETGEDLSLKGFCRIKEGSKKENYKFSAQYNAKFRKGTIIFVHR